MDPHNPHKRMLDTQEQAYKRPRIEHNAGPSKVIHVRNVEPNISQPELNAHASKFGNVVAICFLAQFNQALIEMDSVEAANAVIMDSKQTPVYIGGKEVHLSFSKSQNINPGSRASAEPPPGGVHNVLLCTIRNPAGFTINCDVIYAIMSPYGAVARVVIFDKNNTLQSLVEFENPMCAAQAKVALEGKDIYSGACTLKIEFSTTQKLNVHTNTERQRDFTNGSLPSHGPSSGGGAPLAPYGYPPPAGYGDYYGMNPYGYGMPPMPPPPHESQPTRSVIIAYGLDHTFMTPERIFNLFCLYGNVNKIKPLNGNKGCLIQMGSSAGADHAVQNLNGLTLFGQQLSIKYSKHPFVADSRHETTADGAPAAPQSRDFSSSPLNRFTRNPTDNKHIYKPSATIYFGNGPKDWTEEAIKDYCTNIGAQQPTYVTFFTLPPNENGKEADKKIGLMEFSSISAAAEALTLANNERIDDRHTLKLAFSQKSISSSNYGGDRGDRHSRSSGGAPLLGGHMPSHLDVSGGYGYGEGM